MTVVIDLLVVAAVVALAALYLARRAWRAWRRGGGCAGPCPAGTRLAAEVARAARK